MAQPDTLYVLAAAYDNVASAVEDYEAVKALYYAVKTSHDFDAAVIAKDADGKVSIVKKHEQPTRHGAAVGLGWGLAAASRRRCSRRWASSARWPWARAAAPPSARWPGTRTAG